MKFNQALLRDTFSDKKKMIKRLPTGLTKSDVWNLEGTYSAIDIFGALGLSGKSIHNSQEFKKDPESIGFKKIGGRWGIEMEVFSQKRAFFSKERFQNDRVYRFLPRGTTLERFLSGEGIEPETQYILTSGLRVLNIDQNDLLNWIKEQGYKLQVIYRVV